MPFTVKPADTRRLYQQVADRIRELIERGHHPAGARLPPERELAQQLEISRPSLREALIALEIEGRIEIRMGSGIYVCEAPATPSADPPSLGESPSELMQARAVLESSVIALAAARLDRHGLEHLGNMLEMMRHDVQRGQSPVEADRRFHVAIATLTGNSLLARMVGELFDGRHGALSSRMVRQTEGSGSWDAAFGEHEAIYRALEARDPLQAAASMYGHLMASRDRWIAESAGIADAPSRDATGA